MKEKIGIVCLGLRRLPLMLTHAKQLSKCKYRDFHFYLLADSVPEEIVSCFKQYLPNNSSVVSGIFPMIGDNYMSKVRYGVDRGHEYSIKMDEDCVLMSDGWDKFFNLIESMTEKDLFCSGVLSNGIPTCDMFIDSFLPKYKTVLGHMFALTKFYMQLYTSLNNDTPEEWNTDNFYKKVWNLDNHYKGIHPVRVNFLAAKFINDKILENFPQSMTSKNAEILRDGGNEKYPYFCNSLFGIKTKDWVEAIGRKDLYVDEFEEVVLNRYRHETKRNMVIDTGIPVLHTMYNWSTNFQYENELIEIINKTFNVD
jgi:hypothetical protein